MQRQNQGQHETAKTKDAEQTPLDLNQDFPPDPRRNEENRRNGHQLSGLHDLVAMARDDPPDPIPNSAVKTLSADGTAS